MITATVNNKLVRKIDFDSNTLTVDGKEQAFDIAKLHNGHYHVIANNKGYNAEIVQINTEEKTVTVKVNNHSYDVSIKDKYDELLQALGMDNLNSSKAADVKAPMPGLVLKVLTNTGDTIQKGDTLLVLEAMKMENNIKAAADGIVKGIKVKAGDKVDKNQILVQF